VDRIYDAMEELHLFPKKAQISSKALVCHFDPSSFEYGLKVLSALRSAGIASEIYADLTRIKKQLDYANKKQIPFALVIGSEEMSSSLIAIKNLDTGEQEKLYLEQILEKLKR
jgi:histidyl-tRNA synthetase